MAYAICSHVKNCSRMAQFSAGLPVIGTQMFIWLFYVCVDVDQINTYTFEQMYNVIYPPLQYHSEYFAALKILCALSVLHS